MFANVIVNVSASNVDQVFEYYIPECFAPFIKIGIRVGINFGTGNRLVMGYVIDIHKDRQYNDGEMKEIKELFDLKPIISSSQFETAKFIKYDTICPLIRILNLMIPEALRLKTNKYLKIVNSLAIDARIANLFEGKTVVAYTKNLYEYSYVIQKEIEKGNIKVVYELVQTTNVAYVNKYILNDSIYYNHKNELRSDKKREFLNLFKDSPSLTINEIVDNYDISIYMVKDLIKKDFLKVKKERVLRVKDIEEQKNYYLKKPTSNVLDTLEKLNDISLPYLYIPKEYSELENVLLHKILSMLKQDKVSIILCADILSSFKYASLIRKTFKINVACINSNISSGQYLDYYLNILDSKYKVIVTTPKGIFLPYQNVGLYFMLDEESENYFNDQSPRYDLHRVLHYLSHKQNSLCIFSSFSPSVTNYCYSLKNRYKLVDNSFIESIHDIEVVDLRKELLSGNQTYLSKTLKNAIIKTKAKNEVSLLVVNNIHTSSYVMCRDCGTSEKCSSCDVSLSYNEKLNKMICPACGKRYDFNHICKICGSNRLVLGGIGIDGIKRTLEEIPNLRITTLDNNEEDTYSEVLNKICDNEADVVITTSLYLKSLPVGLVSLIGIINFDSNLNSAAFDSYSRAYNLLVSCGKKLTNNQKLIVQTSKPNESPLVNYIKGDYKAFMKDEILKRKATFNEPFYHVNRIIVKAKYEIMFKEAQVIKNTLRTLSNDYNANLFIIGPTYSKLLGGAVIIIKHNFKNISALYQKLYECYQKMDVTVIFDKYPRKL